VNLLEGNGLGSVGKVKNLPDPGNGNPGTFTSSSCMCPCSLNEPSDDQVDGRIENPATGLDDVDSVVEIDSRSQR
jgi:hypothetical protein